jgi:hypothetical protein
VQGRRRAVGAGAAEHGAWRRLCPAAAAHGIGEEGKKENKKIKITEWSWAGQGPFCKFDRNL